MLVCVNVRPVVLRCRRGWACVVTPQPSNELVEPLVSCDPNFACCAADGAEATAEEEHISDSVPTRFFSCPGAADFKVRGANYLADKKKASRRLRPSYCVAQTR